MKVIFITGISSGFGKSMAEFLASRGYRVYGTSRRPANVTPGEGITVLEMDVRDQKSINRAVNRIMERAGVPTLPASLPWRVSLSLSAWKQNLLA